MPNIRLSNRKLWLGFVVSLVAVFYIANVSRYTADRPALESANLVHPEYTSTISVLIKISADLVREKLEAATPKSISGSTGLDIGGNVHGEHLNYTASRGKISLSAQQGNLTANSSVSGSATAKGEYCVAGTGGGGFLGDIIGSLSCHDWRETGNFAAIASGTISNIRLKQDWQLTADFSQSVDVTKAEARILGNAFKVTFKSDLQKAVNTRISKIQADLKESIKNQLNLKEEVEKAWSKFDPVIKINSSPEAWVVFQPESVSLSPVQISGGLISSTVNIVTKVSTFLGEKPEIDEKRPLPSSVSNETGEQFNLKIPMLLSLEKMSQEINTCCSPTRVTITEDPTLSIDFENFGLSEGEGKIIIESEFSTSGLADEVTGTVFFLARPVFDSESHTLRFQEIHYDVSSSEMLLSISADLARPTATALLREKLILDIKPHTLYAKEKAAELMRQLDLGEDLDVDIVVSDISVSDIAVGDGMLLLVPEVQGKVALNAI